MSIVPDNLDPQVQAGPNMSPTGGLPAAGCPAARDRPRPRAAVKQRCKLSRSRVLRRGKIDRPPLPRCVGVQIHTHDLRVLGSVVSRCSHNARMDAG